MSKQTVENGMKAVTAGGIEAVVKAVSAHIDNAGVCKQGCGALLNMIGGSSKHWHRLTLGNK